jgi:hypothetical protein
MNHVAMPSFQPDDDGLAIQRLAFPERTIEGQREAVELPARFQHAPASSKRACRSSR